MKSPLDRRDDIVLLHARRSVLERPVGQEIENELRALLADLSEFCHVRVCRRARRCAGPSVFLPDAADLQAVPLCFLAVGHHLQSGGVESLLGTPWPAPAVHLLESGAATTLEEAAGISPPMPRVQVLAPRPLTSRRARPTSTGKTDMAEG